MTPPGTGGGLPAEPDVVRLLAAVREENGTEIRLLHERVNALLATEAFLTIAYTATMGSTGRWVAVVAPVLAVLGLTLAAMSWPGVRVTAGLVEQWTARVGDVLEQHPSVAGWPPGRDDRRRREADQRRSLLFFRAVPPLFAAVWALLLVVSLTLRG